MMCGSKRLYRVLVMGTLLMLLVVLPAGAGELPVRLVSLSPSVTELLYAIGAQKSLVGASRQCDYPLAAKLKPRFGDFNRPDLPRILGAETDLVLFTEQVRSSDLDALGKAGIGTLVLPARTLEDVLEALRTLGELTGRSQQAGEVAAELRGSIERVVAALAHLGPQERPRVYLEVDGPQVLYSVGRDSFMSDMIRLAGGVNVFAADPRPYFPVTGEEVAKEDPQVMIIDHPFQYKVGVAKRFGWSEVAAVRNGRIYDARDFDMILINRPGPRIGKALFELARLLHPEVFHAR